MMSDSSGPELPSDDPLPQSNGVGAGASRALPADGPVDESVTRPEDATPAVPPTEASQSAPIAPPETPQAETLPDETPPAETPSATTSDTAPVEEKPVGIPGLRVQIGSLRDRGKVASPELAPRPVTPIEPMPTAEGGSEADR
ncbi:MAG: hypothetical protein ACC645_25550, partial [Pirellulales bacterium]